MKHTVQWDIFLRLINNYRTEAHRCLDCGVYLAGFTCVRAALETAITSRYLLELWEFNDDDLKKYGIQVNEETGYIENVDIPPLKKLIDQSEKNGFLSKKAIKAAHRIREYGNRIHPARLAQKVRLPQIGKRNLKARLNDLEIVIDDLLRSM